MNGKRVITLATMIAFLLFGLAKLLFTDIKAEYAQPERKDLVVKVLDVGQGDAIVLFCGKDTILVDSSDTDMKSRLIELLRRENIKTIDLLVATHPHEDHIGGMQEVIKNFTVKKILDSGKEHTTRVYREYLEIIRKKKIPFVKAKKGNIYTFDKGVSLEVLWPGEKFLSNTNSDLNNNSIVLKVKKEDFSMLLTGDIEKEAEQQLVKEFSGKLGSNVLKSPHHGSYRSSTNAFLREVSAQAVIISCGKDNEYGFPHKDVMKRYKNNGMQIYVTAADGSVTVTTDGKKYQIKKDR